MERAIKDPPQGNRGQPKKIRERPRRDKPPCRGRQARRPPRAAFTMAFPTAPNCFPSAQALLQLGQERLGKVEGKHPTRSHYAPAGS